MDHPGISEAFGRSDLNRNNQSCSEEVIEIRIAVLVISASNGWRMSATGEVGAASDIIEHFGENLVTVSTKFRGKATTEAWNRPSGRSQVL